MAEIHHLHIERSREMVERVNALARALEESYPGCWRQFEDLRASRGSDLPSWPPWCYCPMAGAYGIASGGGNNRVPPGRASHICQLAAVAAWRMTRGVYVYDPDLYQAVLATPPTNEIPVKLFFRLPEWCCLIVTPEMNEIDGFLVHLEHDSNDHRTELRFLVFGKDKNIPVFPLILHLRKTINEGIEGFLREPKRHAVGDIDPVHLSRGRDLLKEIIQPLLNLTLYLCSENPDIIDAKGSMRRPGNPQLVKTKKHGLRLFAAGGPTMWDVGWRIGAALRQAHQVESTAKNPADGTHASPRPHFRRAHWHHYWVGPRESAERRLFLKWISPVLIGTGGIIPTIKKMTENRK